MKKRLLLILMSVFAIMFSACAFTACKGSEDDVEGGGKNPVAMIMLDKYEVSVDAYDSVTVKATVENSDETVVWSSADKSVATVNDGVIFGVAEGETKVTASAGGAFAECRVTVVKSSVLPKTELNYKTNVSLLTGDTLPLKADTTWKGGSVADVTYEWLAQEGQQVADIKQGAANGEFVLTAIKAGSTTLTLKTTAVGKIVFTNLEIIVSDPVYHLVIENIPKENDVYVTKLWREQNEVAELALSYCVLRGGAEFSDATVVWASDDENVATVDNKGIITAKENGTVNITATVSGENITEFTVRLKLTVDELIYYSVTYYDTDRTTILHTDSVLKGGSAPAAYEYDVLPQDKDLGEGYIAQYTQYHWVNENGFLVGDELNEITDNLNLYLAFDYDALKTFEYTENYSAPIATAASQVHKFLTVKNGKLDITFRVYANDVRVGFVEPSWKCTMMSYCYPNKIYRIVLNFDKEGVGTTGTFYENGVPMTNRNNKDISGLTTENLYLTIYLPLTSWDPLTYADSGKVEIGVAATETKNVPYKVTYKTADGKVLYEELVEEGNAATYKRAEETTADGFTVSYTDKWLDSNGNEALLRCVESDLTVYYAGTVNRYKQFTNVDYTNVMSSHPYIKADANGDITFRLRLNKANSFTVIQGNVWVDDKRASVWVDNYGTWYTVKTDIANGKIYVFNPDGSTRSVINTEVKVDEITLCVGNKGDIDIASVENN
jgi:hypothetical protein